MLAALALAAEAVLLGAAVAASQPCTGRLRAPCKGIVYDRPCVRTVIEEPTGRTWAVSPDGTETLIREGD